MAAVDGSQAIDSAPVDDTRRELALLKAEVARLRAAVTAQGVEQDGWRASGLGDLAAGHGAQRYADGNLRLDKTGIQVATHDVNTNIPAMHWYKEYHNPPLPGAAATLTYPHGELVGLVYTAAGSDFGTMYLYGRGNTGNYGFVRASGTFGASNSGSVDLTALSTSGGTVALTVSSAAGGLSKFQFEGAPLWIVGSAADPGALLDGMLWYRTDTDVFHVRANGVTETFAYLSAVIANSLLTTKGDIIVRNATIPQRLGVGANNTVLTADSAQTSGIKWAAVASFAITLQTTNYTAVANNFVLGSNSITVTLPAAASNGNATIGVGNRGNGLITIARTGADIINGTAANMILGPGEQVVFIGDATNSDWRPY